jgi:hypothetical protein
MACFAVFSGAEVVAVGARRDHQCGFGTAAMSSVFVLGWAY